MRLYSKIVYLVGALSLIAAPAFAQNPGAAAGDEVSLSGNAAIAAQVGDEGAGHHERWHHFQLSDDQLLKLATIKQATREKTAPLHAQMAVLRGQMHLLMLAPTPDRQAVLALQAKINALHDQLAIARVNGKLDALTVFTPEQREKIRHHMLMGTVFGCHFHHGGPGQCGPRGFGPGACGGGHCGPHMMMHRGHWGHFEHGGPEGHAPEGPGGPEHS